MQTLKPIPEAKSISALTILRVTIAKSGVRSLYTGVSASILRQMTYSLVRLGSYEKMKLSLSREGRANSWRLLAAAMVAGGLGGVAGNPADVLLVRMTSDVLRPPEKRYNYPNALTGLVSLLRSEGMRGLTRGVGPNVIRAVLMNVRDSCPRWLFILQILYLRVPKWAPMTFSSRNSCTGLYPA
jgi:dicarboxylate transporter 10